MASTGVSTPRSRRDPPSAVMLPKLGFVSNDSFEASAPTSQPPTAPGTRAITPASRLLESKKITPAVRELELTIEPNLGGISKGWCDNIEDKTKSQQQKTPNASRGERNDGYFLGNRKHTKTLTWPCVQYQLWIDTSNLSLHHLRNDRRRTNRPVSTRQVDRTCPDSNLSTYRTAQRTGHTSGEEMELVVGSERWRVGTSQAQRRDSGKQTPSSGKSSKKVTEFQFPRLPSRLGRNTLDCFLDNTNGKMDNNLRVLPPASLVKTNSRPADNSDAKRDGTAITPWKGAKTEVLKLKTFTRNPLGLQDLRQGMAGSTSNNRRYDRHGASQDGVKLSKSGKKLSFKIPSAGFSEKREKDMLGTDVSLPPSPKNLEDTYHIMTYIATKI